MAIIILINTRANAQWAKQAVDVSVLISVKNIWLLDNKIFLANGVQKYFIYFWLKYFWNINELMN